MLTRTWLTGTAVAIALASSGAIARAQSPPAANIGVTFTREGHSSVLVQRTEAGAPVDDPVGCLRACRLDLRPGTYVVTNLVAGRPPVRRIIVLEPGTVARVRIGGPRYVRAGIWSGVGATLLALGAWIMIESALSAPADPYDDASAYAFVGGGVLVGLGAVASLVALLEFTLPHDTQMTSTVAFGALPVPQGGAVATFGVRF